MKEVEKKVWDLLAGKKRGGRTFSETVEALDDTGQAKSQRIVSPVKT